MKIIGLDVGEKTIGLAVSDAFGWTAQGITTLYWEEGDYEKAFKELDPYMKYHEVERLVVGLPKNMNGTIGERGEACQEFAEKLREYYNLPVDLWDERLTTMAAERVLLDADMSRGKRKKVIDKMAAVIILQGYLDSKG
ncbi:Holliday junction resolvase RuvX [Pontibacillus yanchengensis]|uniref:Holliday junction resolvase RuvX n=2 Tax=Pontibacillus yanchengensis TaxID=462910 RepID=A0ACC7VHK4_9BACI|nr:Holliday junction resolvase RuvX [Pontibacillus yanchengensis]MYL33374.1 Holliday junction resolvase RuvX [Pontibacillus yanchengensis]MYL53424.1 Holliday junction resolvase RuvX [Pontibacillus yanchengensis]